MTVKCFSGGCQLSLFLITGGAGFFGTILKKELLSSGHSCISIDLEDDPYHSENFTSIKGDIRDRDLLEKIFRENQIDAVFHCAAMLAHDKKKIKELWTSNVDGTQNVADMATKYHVRKIVFLSSNCLWAQNFMEPVKEDEPPNPVEIYGQSKLMGEKILLHTEGLACTIIRCPTIIDEGRLGLLSILFEFIDEGRKLWMVGDGFNRYQFIYAKDLVNACVLALSDDRTEVYHIGSDNVKTFNEVYQYVIDKSGSKSKLAHFPIRIALLGMKIAYLLGLSPLGPYQYKMISSNFVFDTTKIKSSLGFLPTISNEEMLFRSYRFYHENKEEIRSRKNMSAHNVCAKMGIIRVLKWLS